MKKYSVFLLGVLLCGCTVVNNIMPPHIPMPTISPTVTSAPLSADTAIILPSPQPQQHPTSIKTYQLGHETENSSLLNVNIGNESPIKACVIGEDGSILAASQDGLWQWDSNEWVKIAWKTDWPETQDTLRNGVAVTADDQNRIWAASKSGLIMYDGDRWYSIASPLDNLVNQQWSPSYGESNNQDFTVNIQLTAGQGGSIWMLIRVVPEEILNLYRMYSIVARVNEDSYEILSAANKFYDFYYLTVIDKQTIWGSYPYQKAGDSWIEQWTQYVWNGQQWQDEKMYPDVEGEVLESYNPREGQAWIFTGPKQILEQSEGQSTKVPQNHTYRIYHWEQGMWSLVSSFESLGEYYYGTFIMTNKRTGWLLVNFHDVDTSEIVEINGNQTRIYPVTLPNDTMFLWPLCPIAEDEVYLFGQDAYGDGSYSFLFQTP